MQSFSYRYINTSSEADVCFSFLPIWLLLLIITIKDLKSLQNSRNIIKDKKWIYIFILISLISYFFKVFLSQIIFYVFNFALAQKFVFFIDTLEVFAISLAIILVPKGWIKYVNETIKKYEEDPKKPQQQKDKMQQRKKNHNKYSQLIEELLKWSIYIFFLLYVVQMIVLLSISHQKAQIGLFIYFLIILLLFLIFAQIALILGLVLIYKNKDVLHILKIQDNETIVMEERYKYLIASNFVRLVVDTVITVNLLSSDNVDFVLIAIIMQTLYSEFFIVWCLLLILKKQSKLPQVNEMRQIMMQN